MEDIRLGQRAIWVLIIIAAFSVGLFMTVFGISLTTYMSVYLQTLLTAGILWKLNDIHKELRNRRELEETIKR